MSFDVRQAGYAVSVPVCYVNRIVKIVFAAMTTEEWRGYLRDRERGRS